MQQVKAIPVSLSIIALQKNLVKELMLLISLKGSCNGHFHEDELEVLFVGSGLKVRSTFDNQLKKIIKEGWIYQASGSSFYNIRAWHKICEMNKVGNKKMMRYMHIKEVPRFRAYLFAGSVGNMVKKLKYYFEKTESGKLAALLRGGAFRATYRGGFSRQRIGVSMEKVSRLLGFSREYMNRMKISAKKFGYLLCKAIVTRFADGTKKRLNDEITCMVGFRLRKVKKKCSISTVEVHETGSSFRSTVSGEWYSFLKGRTSQKPKGASWSTLEVRNLRTIPKYLR
jgi:hypothetical protein